MSPRRQAKTTLVEAPEPHVWEILANEIEKSLYASYERRWHHADSKLVTVFKPADRTKGNRPRRRIEHALMIRTQL